MKQVVCLSTEPWSPTPGRTQHLITRLKDAQVLYFCPGGGLLDQRWRQPGRKVRPNVTVYTMPPALPVDERHDRLFRLSRQRQIRFLADKLARHRFRRPLLWTTSPVHIHALDALEYDGLVYDCDQVWDELPDRWEGSLAGAADVVFAASPGLADRLSPCSGNIALLPNGVNYPLFAAAGSAGRRGELDHLPGPLLGWAGTIHADLDLTPILYAAQARPAWTFLLLGRREENPLLRRLSRLSNVMLAGPCPLVEVPDYLGRCQVLLDLLRDSQPYTTWSRPGSMSISPPASPSYPCCGRNRWSSSPMWSTAPTPRRSSSICASRRWRRTRAGWISAAGTTVRPPPGHGGPTRSSASWSRRACCEPAPAVLTTSLSFFLPLLVEADKNALPPCKYRDFSIK